ncbi:MAG: DUF3343 domain-containing protein [Lachnospiraceae bacterium]|nr:DUF3343 domain-containing protein [Lachnospiraceae bacterium]
MKITVSSDAGENREDRKNAEKELRVVVAFDTTTQALAMEEAGKEAGLNGRLIPIPRQLTADCGLAWSEPVQSRGEMEQLIREKGLEYHQIVELVI